MSKQSPTPDAQEARYLDAIVRLLRERFLGHPNVRDDQSVRCLRQNLMHSVDYVGSAERLYNLCSQLCSDTTPRGLYTLEMFARSRNLVKYLLGGIKRDLLTRYPDLGRRSVLAKQQPPPVDRVGSSHHQEDSGSKEEDDWQDDEDSDASPYGKHWGRKLQSQEGVAYDEDGDPIVFDDGGERMPPPGYDPLAESDPDHDPEYRRTQVQHDLRGYHIMLDGERIPYVDMDPDDDVAEEWIRYDAFAQVYRPAYVGRFARD